MDVDPGHELLPPAGVCFGYQVRSHLPFNYLRAGEGSPLSVTEGASEVPDELGSPVREWPARPERPFDITLYERQAGYGLHFGDLGWFHINPTRPAITVPEAATYRQEPRAWGIPMALCMGYRGDLAVHAAAVEVDGNAVLFAAPGHHGKTTLAATFLAAGYRLLAEDLTCCRPHPRPSVLPGPAMLRVRGGLATALPMHSAKMVADDGQRTHLAVDRHLRGSGAQVPLGAIVFLRTSDGRPRLERAAPEEALRDLFALTFKLPNDEDRVRCFGGLTAVVAQVQLWNLHRRLVVDELSQVLDLVVRTCQIA